MRQNRYIVRSLLLLVLGLSLAGCDNQGERQAKYLDRGKTFFDQGAYDKARVEYKNAMRIDPTNAEVRYRLGLVEEAQGNIREAFASFVMAEQQNPGHLPTIEKLVQYYLAGQQLEEAQKRINILLEREPDVAQAHALNAAFLLKSGKTDGAETAAKWALKLDPMNVMGYTVLAGVYLEQKNALLASDTVDQAVARHPQNISLLLLKTIVYGKQNKTDKVADAYKTLFKLRPEDANFREALAAVYVNADQKDLAEMMLRDEVAAHPKNWTMKKILIQFLNQYRGMVVAEKEIQDLIKAYPDREDPYFWLADIYINNKATDRAAVLLEQLVDKTKGDETSQESLNARNSLAMVHFLKGDRALGTRLIDHILASEPDNAVALFLRAQMLVENGAYQEAVAALRTVIRDQPKHQQARKLLSEILLKQGFLDLAIDTLSQQVEFFPMDISSRIRLAQLFFLNQEGSKALATLDMCLQASPKTDVAWESKARIAIALKDEAVAQQAIEQLKSFEGQKDVVPYLQAQLYGVQGKTGEAENLYKQVIASVPDSQVAELSLAAMKEEAEKDPKAVRAFLSYLETLPHQNAFAYTLAGQLNLKLREEDRAKDSFKKAIAENPKTQDAYLGLAQIYKNENKAEDALALLQAAHEKVPGDFRALTIEAQILSNLGRYDDSIKAYELLLARNPNNALAANNVAQLIADYKSNDPQALARARLLAEQFIRATNPYFLDTLAWVYFKQRDMDQAQVIYERLMAGGQLLDGQIHYHYGMFLKARGRASEAKNQFEKALQASGDFKERDSLQETLKKM